MRRRMIILCAIIASALCLVIFRSHPRYNTSGLAVRLYSRTSPSSVLLMTDLQDGRRSDEITVMVVGRPFTDSLAVDAASRQYLSRRTMGEPMGLDQSRLVEWLRSCGVTTDEASFADAILSIIGNVAADRDLWKASKAVSNVSVEQVTFR